MTSDELMDDPYTKAILDQSASLLVGVRQSMDDYVLSFFGSKENAERYGHLYILEQEPYEFDPALDTKDKNVMRFTARCTYRLRLKTEKELRESR